MHIAMYSNWDNKESACSAASIARARLLTTLRHVELLAQLGGERLETLCDTMHDAPYERDQYGFEPAFIRFRTHEVSHSLRAPALSLHGGLSS